MKYLKRMLQVPQSTGNTVVYGELGVIPIGYEIDIRRLVFLHHILCLGEDDPVKKVYIEQGQFALEPNWHNEMKSLKGKYDIKLLDIEVSRMEKEKWKYMVLRR